MKIPEKKAYLYNELNTFLKPQGFKLYKAGMDPTFVGNVNDVVVHFCFNFKSYGDITFSSVELTNYDVEDIILEIDMPTMNLDEYKERKKYHLATIRDMKTSRTLDSHSATTLEEVKTITDWYNDYLQNKGQSFVDHYSYLPNVLKEMDRLESEDINWNNRKKGGILAGSLDAYFRGLVISKLCNDPNFDKKLAMTDVKFQTAGYEEWRPYYQKLLLVLDKLDAKYPYYK